MINKVLLMPAFSMSGASHPFILHLTNMAEHLVGSRRCFSTWDGSMPPALKEFRAVGGVKVINKYIEFRKGHGLNKPSTLWKPLGGRSGMKRKGFPKEVTLELLL